MAFAGSTCERESWGNQFKGGGQKRFVEFFSANQPHVRGGGNKKRPHAGDLKERRLE